MEEKGKSKAVFCLLVTAVIMLGLAGAMLYRTNGELQDQLRKYDKLMELETCVNQNFYKNHDEEAAMEGAMKGYVYGLDDPYSTYLTAEEYSDWQTMESGTQTGIGVTVQYDEEGLLIVEVAEGYPADKSGMEVGDIITAVEGEKVSDTGYDEAVASVKGEENTEVQLTVMRDGEEMEFTVTRSEISVTTSEGQMLEGNIGYIRVSAFRENTDEQFLNALNRLMNEGAEAIIFDVRNNGGGMLSSLKEMLDSLLPEGNIAIATYGNGEVETIIKSDAEELDIPMAVIVNENTASAAELFAASLHDFDKAFLVGDTTYGKGIMQNTLELSDGAITLTVATYQTVRGECYHETGITPDYEISLPENFVPDFGNPDIKEDIQLRTAYEKIKKET